MPAPTEATTPGAGGRRRSRILSRELQAWDTGANVAGAAIVFVLLVLVDAGKRVPPGRRTEVVIFSVALVAIGTVVATAVLTDHARPLSDALDADAPITGPARRALFRIPFVCGGVSTLVWLVAAVLSGIESFLRLGGGVFDSLRFAGIVALGGLATGLVVYLSSEWRLRPLVAEAFAAEGPDGTELLPARSRLVMAWALGSAVPMVAVVLLLLDTDAGSGLRGEAIAWILVGLVVGGFTMARTAHALVEPLHELREAQDRVRTGDLTARSPVDDASEVGLLQAAFNEMVAGLEEREVVRDLFGRHVGEEVARRALEGEAALGGELVEASALFVDVIDSTELACTMAPHDLVAVLNDLFAAVVVAADANGGWLNKFEGDAALCVFGPPLGQGGHAAGALRAARQLRDAIDLMQRRHPRLDVGIGVSCGTVFAGNVGAERRYEYTIIGDPVNEASRLSELAKLEPGRVLASDCTVAAAGIEGDAWLEVGEHHLRGRADATTLWAPTPVGARASA
jgi:adenylate cyclase